MKTAGGYPYLTVNGYNPGPTAGTASPSPGMWSSPLVGDKPGEVATLVWVFWLVVVGTALLLAVIAAVAWSWPRSATTGVRSWSR